MSSTRVLATALAGAVSVAAHGFVSNIVINGVSYSGYDTTSFPYQDNPPVVVGWGTSATDLGFVAPDAYGTADIICHRDGTNAGGHATVAAGDKIYLQWNTWPESHHGPVLDYLASCGTAGCESVDKTTLEFFKIDEVGLVDGSAAPGQYGDDLLMANGLGWMVEIPASIKPGFYVLRHEIIALHSAGSEDGAQNYPQCFNLEVTGSGTEVPTGVLGTELYTSDDKGILFNIYTTLSDYPIPGPTVISGASAVEQATSAIKTSASAITGTGTAPAATDAPATTAPATSAVEETTAAPTEPAATTTDEAVTTPEPTTEVVAPTTTAVAPTSTTAVSEPEPTTPRTCKAKRSKGKKSKKSKKVRRHVRDVKERNVAPIQN